MTIFNGKDFCRKWQQKCEYFSLNFNDLLILIITIYWAWVGITISNFLKKKKTISSQKMFSKIVVFRRIELYSEKPEKLKMRPYHWLKCWFLKSLITGWTENDFINISFIKSIFWFERMTLPQIIKCCTRRRFNGDYIEFFELIERSIHYGRNLDLML